MPRFVHHLCVSEILKNPSSSSSRTLVLIVFAFVILSSLTFIEAMRVHPVTTKRNIALRDGLDPQTEGGAPKKLKKLPHVFSKVLELPFRSDADVTVEERIDFVRFVVEVEADGCAANIGNVRAHAVEIHPGVIKIVVRNDSRQRRGDVELSLNRLEVDTWRYRLPSSSLPELATALFVDGELIVTVPKRERGTGLENGREGWGGGSQVVLAL